MKTNLEKHKHYQKKSRYQFCEIPNDAEGKELVRLMKKYLNKNVYKIRVKGQYLDKVKYPDTYWDKGAPIDACTHIRVYIDEKPEIAHNHWVNDTTYGLRHAIHTLEQVYIDEKIAEIAHDHWVNQTTYGLRHAIHTLEQKINYIGG